MEKNVLQGKATRKYVTVSIREQGNEAKFDLLIYIPHKTRLPLPAKVGINFTGNQAINTERGIKLTDVRVGNGKMFPCRVDG